MKNGLILLTLGGPRCPEEVPDFINNFVGRELPAPVMEAIIERYRQIGGSSPLPRITAEQAKKLGEMLGDDYLCLPAFRHSQPSIAEAIESMATAGAARIFFLLLSPFYASVTTGNYIDTARAHLEKTSPHIRAKFIHSWHCEPLFIASWVEKIKTESFDGQAFYLFSAHSLPLKQAAEPYRGQIEETVATVAACASIKYQGLGWQSIPSNAQEPWMTPTVEEKIDEIASAGFRSVIQVPIGFTADHIETLYDIDITHRGYALGKGLSFRRISSLNAGTSFLKALEHIVTRVAKEEP